MQKKKALKAHYNGIEVIFDNKIFGDRFLMKSFNYKFIWFLIYDKNEWALQKCPIEMRAISFHLLSANGISHFCLSQGLADPKIKQ